MGFPLPKLTRKNQHDFFGKEVKHGDLFNYSQAFLMSDVIHLAKKSRFWIDYCNPDKKEYKMHGAFTCYAYEIGLTGLSEKTVESWNTKEESLPGQWDEFNNKIVLLLKKFEEKKEEAAKIRDELRYMAEEITEIVESFDDGVDGIEEALRMFRDAMDDMSRYV